MKIVFITIAVLSALTSQCQVEVDDSPLNDTAVYSFTEQICEFPGGEDKMFDYLVRNIKYPQEAVNKNISGTVLLEFIVNINGSLSDIKVMKSVDKLLDKEAIRVVEKMPKWKPAKQSGKPVRMYFTVPIIFKLK